MCYGQRNINYSEDVDGRVLVTIEGTQFVTLDRVFHLRTEEIISEEEQATADAINLNAEGVLAEIKKAIDTPGADSKKVLKDVMNTQAWKELSKYGNVGIHYDKDTAEYSVTFNKLELINTKDGSEPNPDDPDGTMLLHYEPTPTGFQNVVWDETGFDLFRMTGEYASYNNTDVGSLKSILVARGGYTPDYTDIPQTPVMPVQADYCEADGVTFKQPNGENNYNIAVKEYEEAFFRYKKCFHWYG